MPTVLEMAGLEKPDFVEFNSLLSLARGNERPGYTSIYGCYMMRQRMIRTDGFKLIVYPEAGKMRLFDLENDPMEMVDLSDKPSYLAKKTELWEELLELQKKMNDPLNLESYF